jgi:hypothetical protein
MANATVEFEVPASGDVVCPASLFDTEELINNPHYVCAAKHLFQSVGDQTLQM